MKYTITLLSLFLFSTISRAVPSCDEAYQAATYALQHLKTSLEWNNLESQRRYALRAIEAMEKVKSVTHDCGCKDAYNFSYDALDKLNKSLEQETFETSRYQISKANNDAKEVLISLDNCREDPLLYFKSDEANLAAREQQLIEQQKKLLEDQKRLEKLLEEQKRQQKKLEIELEAKLDAQKLLKAKAEADIQEFEILVGRLISNLDCKEKYPITRQYIRTMEALEKESLEATKFFYMEKMKELAFGLINNLDACNSTE